MHTISSTQFRVIVVTDPQTNSQTNKQTLKQTGPITIHCAAKLSAQCNIGHDTGRERHHANFVAVSHVDVCACTRSPKFGDHAATPLCDGGMADPLETCTLMCYRTEFDRSRSSRMGVRTDIPPEKMGSSHPAFQGRWRLWNRHGSMGHL